MTQSQINQAWDTLFQNKTIWSQAQFLYGHRDQIALTGKVQYMRSFINFGGPLNIDGVRYNDITDRYTDQQKKIADF